MSLKSLAETGNEDIDDEVQIVDHSYFSGILNDQPSPPKLTHE